MQHEEAVNLEATRTTRVTRVRKEQTLEVLADGKTVVKILTFWSDGLVQCEVVPVREQPRRGSPEDLAHRARDAAFKAQILAQRLRERKGPLDDGWAIPLEHPNDPHLVFHEPAFESVTGSLASALHRVLEARDMVTFFEAVNELEWAAFSITAGHYADSIIDVLGPEHGRAAALSVAGSHAGAPPNIAKAWRHGIESWARPDSPDLIERYTASSGPDRFRPRARHARGRVEDALALRLPRTRGRHRNVERADAAGRIKPRVTDAVPSDRRIDAAIAGLMGQLSTEEQRALRLLAEGRRQEDVARELWPDTAPASGQRRVSRILDKARRLMASDPRPAAGE